MTEATPFNEYVGIERGPRAEGRAEMHLVIDERHTNRRGVAHGGVLSTLLDSALGAAVITVMTPEEWCATMSLSVQFLDGPRAGDRIVAAGEVTRRGKRVAFARGEARTEQGRVLATAEGSWYIWPKKPGSKISSSRSSSANWSLRKSQSSSGMRERPGTPSFDEVSWLFMMPTMTMVYASLTSTCVIARWVSIGGMPLTERL